MKKPKDPYDMSREEFIAELGNLVTPEQLFDNAKNAYDFLSWAFNSECNDSMMREWAFQWWQDQTGREYNEIYYKWLDSDQTKV